MTEPLPPLPDPMAHKWMDKCGVLRLDPYQPDNRLTLYGSGSTGLFADFQMTAYAEAARAPLLKRLDEAAEALDSATMFNEDAVRRITELESQLAWTRERLAVAEQKAEKAEKDARRYRWLKSSTGYESPIVCDRTPSDSATLLGDALDAAVDKAMEASK